jgi:predicted phosphoribosyltransferase
MKYKDRKHAGKVLSEKLKEYGKDECVIIGLPNGGIPVAIEIAEQNGYILDLMFVSKITPSFNTEVGYGSVSETGKVTLNKNFINHFGLKERDIDRDTDKTRKKIKRRMEKYLQNVKRPDLNGKTAILVDDGIASGYTMKNAIQTAEVKGAEKIIVAVPTCPGTQFEDFQQIVDEIICPDVRYVSRFAVAEAYENWYDISDERAIEMLKTTDKFAR